MHFAIHAFSSHVEVLNKVTPIDLLVQSAVLFSLTGWLCRICMIYTFIHPIYGNHYLLARAVEFVQNGIVLGRHQSCRLTYRLNRRLYTAPTTLWLS